MEPEVEPSSVVVKEYSSLLRYPNCDVAGTIGSSGGSEEAADAHEGVAYLALLLRDLHVVGEVLEAAAAADSEVPARRVDA